MRRLSLFFFIVAFSSIITFAQTPTQGTFYGAAKDGQPTELPLTSTKVRADISGFIARVTVTQEFQNNFSTPFEAVYTFPLSQNSAVDEMTMTIGERTIRGKILQREEARRVFEQAKTDGKTAALLDQQRPNVFTQSVANILPGSKIVVVISYVETLKFESGEFEFVFPMKIGPRYAPAASKDTAPVIPKIDETRNGRDISVEINLEAGLPVESLYSNSHPINSVKLDSNSARVTLREENIIPNKDFTLRYDVTGKRITDSVLATRPEKDGFFSLVLAPPDITGDANFTPKEIVFVLDTSGSMAGFPIEKAKEAIKLSLDGLNPDDTFNVITFAGDTAILFPSPVTATPENLATARLFLTQRKGGGGTEMMKAIQAALEPSESASRLRIVCFMTDGFVSNEAEILGEIKKYPKARIFSFGIGTNVNRYLLDKMAELGNGEVEYVGPQDDGSAAARRFYERVRTPVLTDISIDWNGLPVADIYPKKLGDLFSAKPVILSGRYSGPAQGSVTLRGNIGGQTFSRKIEVKLPERETRNGVLTTLWARRRVDSLMSELYGATDPKTKKQIEEQITALALEFRLLTQFTSFIAVEETVVTQDGISKRVEVPVSNREADNPFRRLEIITSLQRPPQVNYSMSSGSGSGSGSGSVTLSSAGVGNGGNNDGGDSLFSTDENAPVVVRNPVNEILRRFELHQKALLTLEADVEVTTMSAALNERDVAEGTLIYANDSRVRIELLKPSVETIIIVNNQGLLYKPATKTAISMQLSDEMSVAMSLFRNGFERQALMKSFGLSFRGVENLNESDRAFRLTLTSKEKASFSSIDLWIDANGMLRKITLSSPNGDSTMIELKNIVKNARIDAEAFKVTLPRDVKVIR